MGLFDSGIAGLEDEVDGGMAAAAAFDEEEDSQLFGERYNFILSARAYVGSCFAESVHMLREAN